ncbi:hypothetical protein [Massilia sp. erpn]|uniref:hypothetical protein n=1 Tax=Massilia sp. erpn TaxID=2738142 RepID=UPI00210415F7|nr:hypothetical protein [Massilia sp. erpn]UTY59548.1 hypothetical protein HPQ68_21645 [Massilia sp. erpn]
MFLSVSLLNEISKLYGNQTLYRSHCLTPEKAAAFHRYVFCLTGWINIYFPEAGMNSGGNTPTPLEPPFASPADAPYDKDMESRVSRLEMDLAAVKTDVAVIRSNYVTKEDLQRELHNMTWKFVTFVCSFGTALVAATYFIARHS